MKLNTCSLLTLSLLLTSVISHPAWGAKLYKWVDENGVVSYQDTPPPSGSTIVKEEELSSTSGSTADSSQDTPVNNQPVIVYTIESCDSCETLLARLESWGVPTNEQSLQDGDIQAQILQSGASLQAPILSIDNQFVSNLGTDNLLMLLSDAGYSVDESSIEEDPEIEESADVEAAN